MTRASQTLLTLVLIFVVSCSQVMSESDTSLGPYEAGYEFANLSTASGDDDDYFEYYNTQSGNYLSAIVAQRNHDWKSASYFISKVLENDPDNKSLKSRAMILAIGSEKADQALDIAEELKNDPEYQAVSRLILTIDAIKSGDYDAADTELNAIVADKKVELVKPIIMGWIDAGRGDMDIEALSANPLYTYDALNIASVLDDVEAMGRILKASIDNQTIIADDLERIGDLFYLRENYNQALFVYKKALTLGNIANGRIANKAMLIDNQQSIPEKLLITTLQHSISDGVARSMYDIAALLYQKNAGNSARLFTALSLFLNPKYNESRFLLGQITAQNGQYDEAIEQFSAIPANDDRYLPARRRAADILEQADKHEAAIRILEGLATDFNDLESRIQIGDIYRRKQNFDDAVNAYNKAFNQVENKDDPSTWHLYYVRGMALERLGNWQKAEADLVKALEFRPNHPYILNYLGYSWADKGTNLDQALDMIRKAVDLRPDDGYIVDSLGWVLFQTGQYEESLPYLEKAVEIMPYDPVINDHLGDVYWKVGRKIEARFQWSRVLNFEDAEDDLVDRVEEKLRVGLKNKNLKEAFNTMSNEDGYTPE